MAIVGYNISDLDPVSDPASTVPGAYFELDIKLGPVASGRKNLRITYEQLATLLGGGTPGGTTRALGDVPTAKALAVVAAYQAAAGPYIETDELYYGQYFIDDFTAPGDVFKYSCDIWRPATSGKPTVWKWGRYLEAGV